MILLQMICPMKRASDLKDMVTKGGWEKQINIKNNTLMTLLKGALKLNVKERINLKKMKQILCID